MQAIRWLALGIGCAALAWGANIAVAQTSRPAAAPIVDPYKDVPVSSTRSAAATQAAGVAKATPADPLDTKRVALALALVLVAVYASHRVWRKLGMHGSAGKSSQTLQIISRLALAPRQQILLIRVGRRCVLVGNSGTQMNPLCEIGDPEEAAALLGQTITESKDSVTATFNDVLDGAQHQFNMDMASKPARDAAPDADESDSALASTRDELNSMMDKVKTLSRQFQRTT